MALPMSAWFASSRVAVASKPFEPSAKVTMASRVHVTWSSHSLRMASWNASCLAVRTATGCECIGIACDTALVVAMPEWEAASAA